MYDYQMPTISGQPASMPPVSYGAGAPTTASWTNPDTGQTTSYGGGMPGWAKAGLLGGGMLGLGGLFGGFGGDSGMVGGGADQYMSQIPDILKKYFAPYEGLVQDPTQKLSQIGAGYKQSPGYQFALNQALKGVGQASAAGGMAGSPQQQQQAAATAQGLASQDYGQYMQRALGLYGTGLAGQRGLGEDLASSLMSRAQLAQLQQEEAARQQEQSKSNIWGALGSAAGIAAHFI